MYQLLTKIVQYFTYIIRNFYQKKNYNCVRAVLYLSAILITCLSSVTVSAAGAGLQLTYDGKTVSYSGKQASIELDGTDISTQGTPGILINGYALLSYQDIFSKGLGAECTYNSTTHLITIEQNNILIKLELGSTMAYVNGVQKKLPIAPKKVKYNSANKMKILVPARFVSEALGYTYLWNSSTSTITLTSPWTLYYDNSYHVYTGTQGCVSFDGKNIDVTSMPSVIIDNTALLQAKKVFASGIGADYIYDKSTNTLTISKNGNMIAMTLGSAKALVNNKSYTMDTAARYIKSKNSKKGYIMVPGSFVASHLGYSYTWNKTTKMSIIKTKVQDPELDGEDVSLQNYFTWNAAVESMEGTDYTNLLQELSANYGNNNDSITLEGLTPLNPTITADESKSCIYIDLPGTLNGLGEKNEQVAGGYCLRAVAVTTTSNHATRITVTKSPSSEYYTSISGNKFTIVLLENTSPEYSLKINLPEKVKFSKITDEDQYYNNTFTITIPGNYVEYYNENPILIANKVVQDVAVTLSRSGNTDIVVSTSKLQGYRMVDSGTYITVQVGDPADIYPNIVVLDAGHGGTDSGAVNTGYKEKDINYAVIYEKAKKYFNSDDSNVKAYWTRTTDTFVELEDRASFAEEVGADLFISLHTNSYTAPSVHGFEVYYSASNNESNQSGLTSCKLANVFEAQLTGDLDLETHGKGVKTAHYIVVHKNTVPAILIELGFITNAGDLARMTDETFQDNCAKSIYEATENVFENYPTGR